MHIRAGWIGGAVYLIAFLTIIGDVDAALRIIKNAPVWVAIILFFGPVIMGAAWISMRVMERRIEFLLKAIEMKARIASSSSNPCAICRARSSPPLSQKKAL